MAGVIRIFRTQHLQPAPVTNALFAHCPSAPSDHPIHPSILEQVILVFTSVLRVCLEFLVVSPQLAAWVITGEQLFELLKVLTSAGKSADAPP